MNKQIRLIQSEVLITTQEELSRDTVVLFLPGVSGGAFSKRFDPLVNVSLEAGYAIARMNAWEGEFDVQTHTYAYYQDAVVEAIEYLESLGYKKVITIGKSFGGGVLLSLHHNAISKKILWAPAIGIGTEDTFDTDKTTALSQVKNLQDIKLTPFFIKNDPAIVCIIHGTADTVFPIENSRKIVAASRDGQIVEVAKADHSFKSLEAERILMKTTQNFLKNEQNT